MNERVYQAIITWNLRGISSIVEEEMKNGESPEALIDAMSAGMTEIGERYRKNEIFVPEMMVAAKAMQRGIGALKLNRVPQKTKKKGKFLIGTVAGDMHDLGKNLVADFLQASGFEVTDLGVDVPPERFIEVLKEDESIRYLGLSSLLKTTMPAMKKTVEALKKAGLRERVTVFIGGAPVSEGFREEIGADYYTENAAECAAKMRELTE